jgi:CBS domain-containing protein
MEKDSISLGEDINAFEGAKIMRDRKHGFGIVAAQDGKPVGIVTEWDYVSRIAAEGRDPSSVTFKEMIGGSLVTVDTEQGIDEVSHVMTEKRIRRVLVLHDERAVGVVTSKTILSTLKAHSDTLATQIARLQGPWR